MVAVISVLPVLVAVNCGTLPVPDAANPIAVFEFVQLMVTPVEGVVTKFVAGTITPSFTVMFAGAVTDGTGFTSTVYVTATAHSPGLGVNVYVPFAVLLTVAGVHTPAMPLLDVAGNVGTVAPIQIDADVPKLKVGVTIGFTVTVNVCVVAQIPAVGVNVYTPLVVLLTVDGFHVPVTPLSDVVGNAGTVPPAQIVNVVPKLNVGIVFGVTVTVNVVVVPHCPALGVKV